MPKNKTWLDNAVERIASKPEYAGKTILKNTLPQKMSGILLDFAKPLLDAIDMSDRLALESAIKMAATVWNYSVVIDKPSGGFTGGLNKKSMESMVAKAFSGNIGESVLMALLERKKALYPDIRHGIADFEVKWNSTGTQFHLTVMSTD